MRLFLFALCGLWLFQCCTPIKPTEQEKIIGVKIYDHQGSFDRLFEEWKSIGINTVFASKDLLSNHDFRERAINNQIKTFVILPIFNDEASLKENPEAYAIKSNGELAIDDWVKFACPSDADFKKDKVESIKNFVKDYNPDGLSIDFIRHFVYWEKVFPETVTSSLPNTCFDARCIEKFQEHSKLSVPDSLSKTVEISSWILKNHSSEWTTWKCYLITNMIKEIVEKVKVINPEILINAHIVPWRQGDFDGGIKNIAGQDIKSITGHVDFLSPMTYSHMVKRDARWIHEVVQDFYHQTQGNILPSIQVKEAYLSDSLSSVEFEKNLDAALVEPSKGVVFWSWEKLEQDPWKKEIIKKKIIDQMQF